MSWYIIKGDRSVAFINCNHELIWLIKNNVWLWTNRILLVAKFNGKKIVKSTLHHLLDKLKSKWDIMFINDSRLIQNLSTWVLMQSNFVLLLVSWMTAPKIQTKYLWVPWNPRHTCYRTLWMMHHKRTHFWWRFQIQTKSTYAALYF